MALDRMPHLTPWKPFFFRAATDTPASLPGGGAWPTEQGEKEERVGWMDKTVIREKR